MKIMKTKSLILALFASVLLISCTSVRKTISTASTGSIKIESFDKTQYDILSEVEGYGSATQFLFFGIWNKFGAERGVVGKALGKATYDAISKVEGADILIYPKYEIEHKRYPLIQKATVKVKAKAIQIKATK
jgi:hypothetical protein